MLVRAQTKNLCYLLQRAYYTAIVEPQGKPSHRSHKITTWSSSPTTCVFKGKSEVLKKHLYGSVHSSITHNSQHWKQPKCHQEIEKQNMFYLYTKEYYPATGRNGMLIYKTNFENIKLSKLSQTVKVKYPRPHLRHQLKNWWKEPVWTGMESASLESPKGGLCDSSTTLWM